MADDKKEEKNTENSKLLDDIDSVQEELDADNNKTPKSSIDETSLSPELKQEYEWIKLGEKNIIDFKNRKLEELNAEQQKIRRDYEDYHSQFKNMSPEDTHTKISNPQYKQSTDYLKSSHDYLERQKHKLSSNPNEFLEESKRNFEATRLKEQSDKKYENFKSDESLFDNKKFFGDDYIKKAPEFEKRQELIKKAQKFQETLQNNKTQALNMLKSDNELNDFIKKNFYNQLQQQNEELQRNKNEIIGAEVQGQHIPKEIHNQLNAKEAQLKNEQKSFYEMFPGEKEKQAQKDKTENEKIEKMQKEKEDKNDPFKQEFQEENHSSSGNKILFFSDLHGNLDGLESVFKRAHQLGVSNVRSIVGGGDLIRGVFPKKEDFIKYQKALERLGMIQNMKGTRIYLATPLELIGKDRKVNADFYRQFKGDSFEEDIKNTLEDYAEMYYQAKGNLKNQLSKIKELAKSYNLLDKLVLTSGNYEGVEPLIDEFGEDKVLGFSNIADFEIQKRYDMIRNKGKDEKDKMKSFKSKVINAGGLKFFGFGGSSSSTQGWIPPELSEHYGDLNQAELGKVGMQALGSVIRPIITFLDKDDEEGLKFKDMAEKGTLSPLDLKKLEEYFVKKAKSDEKFKNQFDDKFKNLFTKFEKNFDLILQESHKDALFISDRMRNAKAHIHVSHHPIDSDLGYFEGEGNMTGGVLARSAILSSGSEKGDAEKNYSGYTLGLYGHTHESRVDVLKKNNGKYFFAVSTKGLNYDEKNSEDKLGITEIRPNLKGEFAEIELDANNELTNYTIHKTAGNSIYESNTKSRDDILNERTKSTNEKALAFNTLDYDEDEYLKKAV